MNFDHLNRWLTLIANVGVLIGIVFLAREIDQSNRIAERDGRSELVSNELEFQSTLIENPDRTALMVKLRNKGGEYSPEEVFEAEIIAQQLLLRIADLTINYETGFLEGPAMERQIRGVMLNIERIPGIATFLLKNMQEFGMGNPAVASPIFDRFFEQLQSME